MFSPMAISVSLNNAMTFLRGVPAAAADIFAQHLKTLGDIRQRYAVPIGSTQGQTNSIQSSFDEAVSKAKTEAFQKLEALTKQINSNETLIRTEAAVAIGLQEMPAGVNEQLLKTQRMSDAWRRIQPAFDRMSNDEFATEGPAKVSSYVLNACRSQDDDTIASMFKELPFYVAGRFDDTNAEGLNLQIMTAFEDAIASERPSVKEVLDFKRELDRRGTYNARLSVSLCRDAIEKGDVTFLSPLWGTIKTTIVDENGLQLQQGGFDNG
jgi:hypothetical protein